MEDSLVDQILSHLYDCMDYGFSRKFKKGLFIEELFSKKIGKGIRQKSFNNLKRSKFITQKQQYDGSVIVSLSEKGRLRALNIKLRHLDNKKQVWDKKWRMVSFDIPNTHRKGRDAIRYRLKTAGFYELQESMFLSPYDCEREVKGLVALFKLNKYVRFALVDFIDGQDKLITRFSLE